MLILSIFSFFFFNDTATTEIYTLSLHDALPISAIPQTDPSCAIAYWGIAISQRPNPLAGPFDTAALKNGLEAIEKGQAIGAKATRERDWLAAAREFFKDYESVAQEVRTSNYARAMRALAAKYPEDDE